MQFCCFLGFEDTYPCRQNELNTTFNEICAEWLDELQHKKHNRGSNRKLKLKASILRWRATWLLGFAHRRVYQKYKSTKIITTASFFRPQVRRFKGTYLVLSIWTMRVTWGCFPTSLPEERNRISEALFMLLYWRAFGTTVADIYVYNRSFSCPKRPDRLRSPLSHLFIGFRRLFSRSKTAGA